jgi:hypothetical protein
MTAKEYFEAKYPIHTRLKKDWCIELMESYAQIRLEEFMDRILKLQNRCDLLEKRLVLNAEKMDELSQIAEMDELSQILNTSMADSGENMKMNELFFKFLDEHYSHASENYRKELKDSFLKYLTDIKTYQP